MSRPTNLVTVRPGVTLEAAAAASFQRVEKRAGRRVDVNSSYRDWDEQMRHYLAYQRHLAGGPWAPLALHPDKSMHCKGLAIDSDDHTLMRNAGYYGWRSTVASEPWHFDYFRHLDKHLGEPVGGDERPLPTPEQPAEQEDEDVSKNSGFKYTRSSDKKTVYLIVNAAAGWWFEYLGSTTVPADSNNAVATTFDTGPYAEVNEAFATALKKSLPRAQGVVVSGELTTAES